MLTLHQQLLALAACNRASGKETTGSPFVHNIIRPEVKARAQLHMLPLSIGKRSLGILRDYEDWRAKTLAIMLDIPGIQAKEHHTDEELRSLTLEALSVVYLSTAWAKAYTDGSAEEAAKNGGGGVFIKLSDDRSIRKSEATEQQSTNYTAESDPSVDPFPLWCGMQ